MPPISAVVHTYNDALRIGRALESLRACDEVIVFDHGSQDGTLGIVREHGARVVDASEVPAEGAARRATHPWVLVLQANEVVMELLEAELYELRLQDAPTCSSYSVTILEEIEAGWEKRPAETRLVPREYACWQGPLPAPDPNSHVLAGALLRLRLPI
jgi:glycosyltransferase involved in cell wall biosynthesis